MARAEEFANHTSNHPHGVFRLFMCARICSLLLFVSMCLAQDVKLPTDEGSFKFGVTVVSSAWLKGDIYPLNPKCGAQLASFHCLFGADTRCGTPLNLSGRLDRGHLPQTRSNVMLLHNYGANSVIIFRQLGNQFNGISIPRANPLDQA